MHEPKPLTMGLPLITLLINSRASCHVDGRPLAKRFRTECIKPSESAQSGNDTPADDGGYFTQGHKGHNSQTIYEVWDD